MMSETVNVKAKNQSLKKLAERTGVDNKGEVNKNKKDVNIGLRVPGSNWQKFRSHITETTDTNQSSSDIQIKRKKCNRKPVKTANDQGTPHEPNQVIVCIINNLLLFIQSWINIILDNIKNLINLIFYGLEQQEQTPSTNAKENEKKNESHSGLTKVIAMDCEMVGIGDGQESMIARVSIVNRYGVCVYDKYVKPTEEVIDYRTPVSGIQPHHLRNGHDFKIVQKEVSEILRGRTLVGHALHNDLAVLFLSHPKRFQRDTARYKLFRKVTKGNTPSLKRLASELLGIDIQSGEHNSIEDAHAAMQLYQLFRKKWENDIRTKKYS